MDENLSHPEVGLTDLSLCEILRREPVNAEFQYVRNVLLAFTVHSTGGADLAIQNAEPYRFLRQRGITIRSTIDRLIDVLHPRRHFLLHNDRDFEPFERHLGLKVLHP